MFVNYIDDPIIYLYTVVSTVFEVVSLNPSSKSLQDYYNIFFLIEENTLLYDSIKDTKVQEKCDQDPTNWYGRDQEQSLDRATPLSQ